MYDLRMFGLPGWVVALLLSLGVGAAVASTRRSDSPPSIAKPRVQPFVRSVPVGAPSSTQALATLWDVWDVIGEQEPYKYDYLWSHETLPTLFGELERRFLGDQEFWGDSRSEFLVSPSVKGRDGIVPTTSTTKYTIWFWDDARNGWVLKVRDVSATGASQAMLAAAKDALVWVRLDTPNA